MRRTWFEMRSTPAGDAATISIYDEIGGWGITAKQFIEDFAKLTANAVTLEINSPGGSVFDALAMYNAMKNSGKDITVKVMGIAASAASYIAMVGSKIVMPDNTFMMVHNPLNAIYGNAADMREMADVLDKIGNSLVATYVARTGQSDATVRDLLAKDSYLTAQECLDLGFADELIPAVTATAKFEREHLPENIQALFASPDNPDDPDSDEPPTEDVVADAPEAFATQLAALAEAAGMTAYAAIWALDASVDSLDKVKDRISVAREIEALCAVAKRPADAIKFIGLGKSLAEARSALSEVLAAGSAGIDTTQTSSDKPVPGAGPSAVTTASIWASHNNLRSKK